MGEMRIKTEKLWFPILMVGADGLEPPTLSV
jgi:hypothetical protein